MTDLSADPASQPKSADAWAAWFWDGLLPGWLSRVQDLAGGGVYDALALDGSPDLAAEKTVLAQARTLFSIAHLALLSDDPALYTAAGRQVEMLRRFRKASGLYRRATSRFGEASGLDVDELSRTYDQCFVILGLVTWNKLAPSAEVESEIEACWQAITGHLTDPQTGLLLEDDSLFDPAAPEAPPRAQNPHMHLYEACLQAYEMTGRRTWLDRARHLRAIALRHFFDSDTGSLVEFIAPDLSVLAGAAGARREPGHQYEWAWLLSREAELGGDTGVRDTAARLMQFADRFGCVTSGPLRGAACDALWPDGAVMEDTCLLWPQTEAIKALAVQYMAGDAGAGPRARELLCLMFERWFAGHAVWINRVDATGKVIWPEALTRLFYHIVLALTEGARAGLWRGIAQR